MSGVLPESVETVRLGTRMQINALVLLARVIRRRSPQELRRFLRAISHGTRPATYTEARTARDQILSASPPCRGRSACLIRSLTVAMLCRARGVWPTWCVGVLVTPPFAAHAWVEADGRLVGEALETHDLRTLVRV